jgi:hypothetical protein
VTLKVASHNFHKQRRGSTAQLGQRIGHFVFHATKMTQRLCANNRNKEKQHKPKLNGFILYFVNLADTRKV